MGVLHHHPRFHLHLSPQLLILFMLLVLFIMALWLLSLSQARPTERAMPQPVIAVEQDSQPKPHPFYWLE